MKTLHECLAEYDIMLLKGIAERRGVELPTLRQPDMVEQLTIALLEPASLKETLPWLTEQEREALDLLLLSGGRVKMLPFVTRFGEIRRFGPASLAREAPWRKPIGAAEGLWYQALIGRGFVEQDGLSVEYVFVPTDLVPLLPVPERALPVFEIPESEPPARIVSGDPALIDDMCMFLAWVQNFRICVRDGQLEAQATAEIQPQLLDKSPDRLAFILRLAQVMGFLYQEGRTLRLYRDPVLEWLKRYRAEQLRQLQYAWRDDGGWNELWRMPGLVCEETGWSNDPLLARQEVLALLRRCPANVWISLSDLIAHVKQHQPTFLRPDGDFESWYIRDKRTNQYLTGFEHWDTIEGALLNYFFAQPIHWLGIVSLGYQEGRQKPVAFRLTPWGRAFFNPDELVTADLPVHPALLSPDGLVVLPREASLNDRFQLARVAEWRASRPDYEYEITSEAVRRAFKSKIPVQRIETFLDRIGCGEVPAALIARLRGWDSLYGQVRLRRVVLLETRTPRIMVELQAQDRIRPYLRQSMGPTAILVREHDWEMLIQELERAGYLPEIMD